MSPMNNVVVVVSLSAYRPCICISIASINPLNSRPARNQHNGIHDSSLTMSCYCPVGECDRTNKVEGAYSRRSASAGDRVRCDAMRGGASRRSASLSVPVPVLLSALESSPIESSQRLTLPSLTLRQDQTSEP